MSKIIIVKLKKVGSRVNEFSISDNYGNVLAKSVTKKQLIQGIPFEVDDNVSVIILTSLSKDCCGKTWNIPISTTTQSELAAITFEKENTSSLWRHLTNPQLYNNFYGCIHSYIIEYPFSYQYNDEVVQNVKDYTKVFKYLSQVDGVFNYNRKVQTNNDYFNFSVLYNDQQSSGILELVPKPQNNLSAYLQYPKYNSDSKTILFTKKDNFYQYNTFWDVSNDKQIPLFVNSCESLSIDKEVNQSNMIYTNQSYRKFPLRAKDSKLRMLLTNRSDIHIVSQFVVENSQVSYN